MGVIFKCPDWRGSYYRTSWSIRLGAYLL